MAGLGRVGNDVALQFGVAERGETVKTGVDQGVVLMNTELKKIFRRLMA